MAVYTVFGLNIFIMLTCPYNVDPLTSHFYTVNMGFTGVYVCLIFALKHRLRQFYSVPTIYVLSKNKKNITIFHLKIIIFTAVKNHSLPFTFFSQKQEICGGGGGVS